MDHHEQSLDGKARVGRWPDAVGQRDDSVPIVEPKLGVDVVKQDAEARQDPLERAVEVVRTHHRLAQQREASDLHATRVEPEELVVQFARHGEPQGGERLRRDACMGRAQHFIRDPCDAQHAVPRRRGQTCDRCRNEMR